MIPLTAGPLGASTGSLTNPGRHGQKQVPKCTIGGRGVRVGGFSLAHCQGPLPFSPSCSSLLRRFTSISFLLNFCLLARNRASSEFHGVSRTLRGLLGASRTPSGLLAAPRTLRDLLGAPRTLRGLLGALRTPSGALGLSGASSQLLGALGLSGASLQLLGLSGASLALLGLPVAAYQYSRLETGQGWTLKALLRPY